MLAKIAAIVACATLIPSVTAQETGPKTHARLGIATSSMYFFRGLLQENGGLIVQPEMEVSRDGGELFDRPFGWHVGTWNSLHSGNTGSGRGGGTAAWYESQFFAGFTVSVLDNFDVRTQYRTYHSPNGNFRVGSPRPTQELDFKATWNDSEGRGNEKIRGFFPYAEIAFELAGGRDAGGDKGVYLELGAEPVFAATDDLLVTLPVRLGTSMKDYYEDGRGGDDVFGFLSFGAETTLDVCDESNVFGPWQLRGTIDFYVLGDTAKRINNGNSVAIVAGLGLSLSF